MNPKTGIILASFGAGFYAAVLLYKDADILYVIYLLLLLGMAIGLTFVKKPKKTK